MKISGLLRKKNIGFTLVELLIVVAIIGILSAVALPSYLESQLRSARADGKGALMQAAATQEQIYSASGSYAVQAAALSTDGKYSVVVAACAAGIANCFVATATPQGNQTDDTCGSLTITNTGLRGASGGGLADCWQR